MLKLLKYLKGPAIFYAILAPILMLLEVAMDLTLPTMLSNIVDIGIANSDINYVLQFKIIDEGNTICEYLFNKLRKRYNKLNIEKNLKKSMEQVKNESNIVSTDDTSKSSSFLSSISREDITLLTSFEELISKDKAGEKIASRSIKSLNNGFIHKIKNLLLEIDNDNKYRAKFVNLCIFFRYGFKSRLSHKHNSGINLEDESASISSFALVSCSTYFSFAKYLSAVAG